MASKEPRSYTLQLPLPPAELHPNARVNWRAKHRVKSAYRQLCGAEAYLQILSRPMLPAVQIAATFRRTVGRNGQYQQHDPDNLIAWLKTAIDSLQDSGLLADDRQVQYAHPRQERCDDKPGLELIVTEVGR